MTRFELAIVALGSGVASAALSPGASATNAPPVPATLLACAKLQNVNERVRCYDTEVAAMSRAATSSAARSATPVPPAAARAAPPAAPAALEAAAAAPAAPAAAKSGSTTSLPPAQVVASATQEQSPDTHFGEELLPPAFRPAPHKEAALVSTITAVHAVGQELGPKVFLISLANGQVWREQDSRIATFFRPGEEVHIERHELGSYHMWTPDVGAKNWVRVARVR